MRTDTELRILSEFEPAFEQVLEPGDVLYLPPGLPHWGVALEDCMTYSIGFHAPSYSDMLTDWCQFRLEHIDPGLCFRDPPLESGAARGLIGDAAFDAAEKILGQLLAATAEDRRRWFGRLVTQTKPHLGIEPREPELDSPEFQRQLVERTPLHRHPFVRLAWADLNPRTSVLFVNGLAYDLPSGRRGFILALAQHPVLHQGFIAEWLNYPDCVDLITNLYNAGYLNFHDESV
jgi:50S ribosomal protein L16 3-hydroxylase